MAAPAGAEGNDLHIHRLKFTIPTDRQRYDFALRLWSLELLAVIHDGVPDHRFPPSPMLDSLVLLASIWIFSIRF
ncbi:hypothetical protein CH292_06005 [Rhodococcus sp. 14-2470-1a]|nr:hypothetical protein CH292_06005 [Rhodococcus sp. 14-2470-1a]